MHIHKDDDMRVTLNGKPVDFVTGWEADVEDPDFALPPDDLLTETTRCTSITITLRCVPASAWTAGHRWLLSWLMQHADRMN